MLAYKTFIIKEETEEYEEHTPHLVEIPLHNYSRFSLSSGGRGLMAKN